MSEPTYVDIRLNREEADMLLLAINSAQIAQDGENILLHDIHRKLADFLFGPGGGDDMGAVWNGYKHE